MIRALRPLSAALLGAALLAGCAKKEPAEAPPAGEATAAAKAEAPAAPAPPVAAAEKPPAKPTPAERKAKSAIKWPEAGVEWIDDWAAARTKSAETGKPICLVVYADWCPRCQELAPLFAEPDLVEASKGLIMVRQDNDARPEWLQAYADQGTYVPRIFFFGADGHLRTDVTSGHPRFPFFYSSRQKDALVRSMKTVAGS